MGLERYPHIIAVQRPPRNNGNATPPDFEVRTPLGGLRGRITLTGGLVEFPTISVRSHAMKGRIFWRVIAVGVVLGLFAVAYGLCKNGQVLSPSFATAAYGAEHTGKPRLVFEDINATMNVTRAKVPGGWLVAVEAWGGGSYAITFYPDPKHEWDGGSIK